MSTITLIPAYGRDYPSANAVLADFLANKDFVIADIGNRWDGKPVNREQLDQGSQVRIRYQNHTKVALFTVGKEPTPKPEQATSRKTGQYTTPKKKSPAKILAENAAFPLVKRPHSWCQKMNSAKADGPYFTYIKGKGFFHAMDKPPLFGVCKHPDGGSQIDHIPSGHRCSLPEQYGRSARLAERTIRILARREDYLELWDSWDEQPKALKKRQAEAFIAAYQQAHKELN